MIMRHTVARTLPLQPGDIPILAFDTPAGRTGRFEVTQEQYEAVICALFNTPDDSPETRTFMVRADDDLLRIRARGIFHAFNIARGLRPDATVISDANTED